MTGAPIKTGPLMASHADWISPAADPRFRNDGSTACLGKVILVDTDHLNPTSEDPTWPWRCLTRGNHFLLMDWYMDARVGSPRAPGPTAENVRRQMGYTVRYSQRVDLPRIYHYQWMQYLLDNYASVEQVIASLDEITVDGHCTWHFFVGDHTGQVAIIEFLEGQPVVHVGAEVPVKVLCNVRYASALSGLQAYQGFGGTEPVDFQDRSSEVRLD